MEFRVHVLGGVQQVTLDSSLPAEVRDSIRHQWHHLVADASAQADGSVHLSIGAAEDPVATGSRAVTARDAAHAPDLLASTLTLAGIRNLAGRALMFHAAGLAAADGQTIALVGPSGRGKTTAAVELGRTMAYVTDETVAFTSDLRVIPYPKPLSIGHRPGVKSLSPPSDLGMRLLEGPARLAALLLLDRRVEPVTARLEAVSLADAIGDLVGQTSSFSRISHPLRTLADVVAATGGVRRIVYSAATDLAALVDQVLGSPPAPVARVETVVMDAAADVGPGEVGRAPFVDAAWIDGRLTVLTSRRIHVLDGIGPALWMSADGKTLGAVTDAVRAVVGEPSKGVHVEQAVERAVEEMTAAGLLVRG